MWYSALYIEKVNSIYEDIQTIFCYGIRALFIEFPDFLETLLETLEFKSLSLMENADNVCVRFTRKKYGVWAFQIEIFLKGKVLWSHVDDSEKEALDVEKLDSEKDAEESTNSKAIWAAKDAQIMS